MTNEIVILYIIIMDEELTCNLCMKSFISHYALSLHIDIIHTFNYKCWNKVCNKGFMYSFHTEMHALTKFLALHDMHDIKNSKSNSQDSVQNIGDMLNIDSNSDKFG